MKKSTVWLIVGIGAMVMVAIIGCCGALSMSGSGSSSNVTAAAADVDLEKLAQAYKTHIKSGAQDLNGFEAAVNKPSIYKGSGYVRATMDSKGQVVGYVDKDSQPGYKEKADELVFTLNADQKEKRIVASDRHRRHYGLRASDVFGVYLMSRMLSGQRGYYGGRYWTAPSRGFVKPGYYNRVRSTSSGSRSFRSRSNSSGYRSRSGSRSGGFGFGK